jgi:hypothetical protein
MDQQYIFVLELAKTLQNKICGLSPFDHLRDEHHYSKAYCQRTVNREPHVEAQNTMHKNATR